MRNVRRLDQTRMLRHAGRRGLRDLWSTRARPSRLSVISIAATIIAALIGYIAVDAYGLNTSAPASSAAAVTDAAVAATQITVVDGDTIRTPDHGSIRLVGFNAPETDDRQATCPREKAVGVEATARLKQLVAGGDLSLGIVRCSCKPGTDGTDRCNYGRACGRLLSQGRDVGDILISEGLAVRYVCGATSCPRRSKAAWCG